MNGYVDAGYVIAIGTLATYGATLLARERRARQSTKAAVAGLEALIARFDDPATPYRARPRPDKAPRYSDYEHLARVKQRLYVDSVGDRGHFA